MESVWIRASDGAILGGSLFRPRHKAVATVSVHSGTGVKKELYANFAKYLCEHGYAVLLFDYRGIGESRPGDLSSCRARMRDWGALDMSAALGWLKDRFPELPAFIVGHSMGGQLIGLMPNHSLASGIVTIAASTAYWADLPLPYNLYTASIWYGLVPLSTRLAGYFPSKRLRLGEDLPSGVAQEWAKWCTTREYLRPHFGRSLVANYFSEVKLPLKAYVLAGDWIATPKTVPKLMSYFSKCRVDVEFISREAAGGEPGHFGFFSRRYSATLWPKPRLWLDAQLAREHRGMLSSGTSN